MELNFEQLIRQTRAEMEKTILGIREDTRLQKGLTVSTGLVGINLDAPAHQLVPLLSPFRQSIPRVTKPGSSSATWRQITALSTPKLSVAESAASALFTTTLTSPTAAYKGMGLRGQVTREAEAGAQGFDPALAKETRNTLENYMKMEEQYILGGNITALAAPGTIAAAVVDTFGTLPADEYFVNVQALTLPAANRETIDRPIDYAASHAVVTPVAGRHTNARAIADGWGVNGTETSDTTVGANDGLEITWDPVPGAAAYAVFVGLTTGDANLNCEVIVTQTSVLLTSVVADGETADTVAADTSADALAYDGIIQHVVASGSGAALVNQAGVLAQANGEITAIQDVFTTLWNNAKIGEFRIVVAGQEARSLSRLGFASNSVRLVIDPAGSGNSGISFGTYVGRIMNNTTGQWAPVEAVPWMPGGSILILPTSVPYNDANISDPFDMWMGFDVERWDYASTTSTGPIYPFEVRTWGVLRALFTGGCGFIYNIFKG